jgi:hypothetical protein
MAEIKKYKHIFNLLFIALSLSASYKYSIQCDWVVMSDEEKRFSR